MGVTAVPVAFAVMASLETVVLALVLLRKMRARMWPVPVIATT